MIFGQLGSGFGWQQQPSFIARLLAMRALWAWPDGNGYLTAWPDGEAALTEWTED